MGYSADGLCSLIVAGRGSVRLTCGLSLALLLALPSGSAGAQSVDLSYVANATAPTTISVNVNAMMAGGPRFGDPIAHAIAARLNGSGYVAVPQSAPHHVDVAIMLYSAPQCPQTGMTGADMMRLINQANRESTSAGILHPLGSTDAQVPAETATCMLTASAAVTIDGKPLPMPVFLNIVSTKATMQEAMDALPAALEQSVVAMFIKQQN